MLVVKWKGGVGGLGLFSGEAQRALWLTRESREELVGGGRVLPWANSKDIYKQEVASLI